MISYSSTITDKAGREVQISGSSDLIDRIGEILEANGFKWNDEVECWDEGFYETPEAISAIKRYEEAQAIIKARK